MQVRLPWQTYWSAIELRPPMTVLLRTPAPLISSSRRLATANAKCKLWSITRHCSEFQWSSIEPRIDLARSLAEHALRRYVCELMLQLARGLAHAHHHGIVHSDLKPANVLIGDDGQARLVDFNVAQRDGGRASLFAGGTLPYMAPEAHQLAALRSLGSRTGQRPLFIGCHRFSIAERPNCRLVIPQKPLTQALDACLAERQNLRFAHQMTSTMLRSMCGALLRSSCSRGSNSVIGSADQLARRLATTSATPAAAPRRQSLGGNKRLTKWTIRHPRISSATTVTIVATLAMLLMSTSLIYYRIQYRSAQSAAMVAQFQAELPTALLMAAHYREYGDLEAPTREAAAALLNTLLKPNTEAPHVAVDYLPASDKAMLASNLRELDKTLYLAREDRRQTVPS